jgi:hypothetical protein
MAAGKEGFGDPVAQRMEGFMHPGGLPWMCSRCHNPKAVEKWVKGAGSASESISVFGGGRKRVREILQSVVESANAAPK